MKRKKFFMKRTLKHIVIAMLFVVGILAARSIVRAIRPQATQILKEIACGSNSTSNGFCKKQCGEKDASARWCDEATYNDHVPQDKMVVHVAEGGCGIAALNCAAPNNCPADVWTCMAECPPDPNREITEKGCGCRGNLTPEGGKCLCRNPFILKNGECVPAPVSECRYDKEKEGTFFACIVPGSEVEIYWENQLIYKCEGACYSYLCVSNSGAVVDEYLYSHAGLREELRAEKGSFKSLFPAIGGFYEVCRTPLHYNGDF